MGFEHALQLSALLAISNPEAALSVTAPSPNPVANAVGDRYGQSIHTKEYILISNPTTQCLYNFSAGYPILYPLGPTAGTFTDATDPLMPGLTFIPALGIQQISSTALSNSAVSLLDFNVFR